MQQASTAYDLAIESGHRRTAPKATIELIDPDIVYEDFSSSGQITYAKPEQLFDKEFEVREKYVTLEPGRWMLGEEWRIFPDDPQDVTEEVGFIGSVLSGADGSFSTAQFVRQTFSNLSILQAASIHFTGNEYDGHGVDFTFSIYSGDTQAYQKAITGNQERAVYFEGFTVEQVTAIEISFTKWSMPGRYVRIAEIVPGIYENWDSGNIYQIDVMQETAFDCLTVPYGSCTVEILNQNQRFNPFQKSSLFQSIEARQGIPVSCGVELPDATFEYLPLGVYYQQDGGWQTDAYGPRITFKLVDIIGLLANLDFTPPSSTPTTLEAWIAAIVARLGVNFEGRYLVEDSIADIPLSGVVTNLSCGQVLRYACMAAKAFFRADAATGYLRVSKLPEAGGVQIGLANQHSYPKNSDQGDVGEIIFKLSNNTEYRVSGTGEKSDKSLNISNPFIKTTAEADAVAEYILQFYGGTKFEIRGRGNMRCELGDLDTIETGFGGNASGRRYKQQFKFTNGIMKEVPSYLLSQQEVL